MSDTIEKKTNVIIKKNNESTNLFDTRKISEPISKKKNVTSLETFSAPSVKSLSISTPTSIFTKEEQREKKKIENKAYKALLKDKNNQHFPDAHSHTSNAIELKNFSIIFDKGKPYEFKLLHNINHVFEKNKIHFIAGNSGSGKTVLISYFNGLNKTKDGMVCIFDKPILIKHKKVVNVKGIRRNIGMVFQFAEYQLFKSTIEKDIVFGPLNFKVKKNEAKKRAKKYIKDVGLDESFLPRNPFGLSGGQKRRVAIAGILAIEPQILVFDEPTAGLDPDGEKELIHIFSELKKVGKTVIIVTHCMNQAIEIGDTVTVIGDGKILKTGDTYEIFNDKSVVKKAALSVPLIYKTIEALSEKNPKYKELFMMKPRTIEELVKDINILNGGGQKC
ncbi:MAG: hypothetical protein Ta2E_04750 [Mycoplasmoidaceae bacterium]|nr:MAG: hypothetical protein Ta2E_04750 [Mycoplasmoidaceae bacterium]